MSVSKLVEKGLLYEQLTVEIDGETIVIEEALEYDQLIAVLDEEITLPVVKGQYYEELVVYLPPDGEPPSDILLSPQDVPELVDAAVIGIVTVIDVDLPNDAHTFDVSDSRFEIVDGVFALKSGQQLVFASEPTVTLTITATDISGQALSKIFTLTVVEQVVPAVNHAPTDVLLDNTTIADTELGGVVGNVTGVDEDMPDDTLVFTVDDTRFVIVPTGLGTGELRLKPNKFVSHFLEPTIALTLTVTDAGGLSAFRIWNIDVTDIPAPDLTNAYFVAPTVRGSGNGSSFADAYGITSLNTVVSLARTNSKQVLLASHFGTYGTYSSGPVVTLSTGGISGVPVLIRGCNAAGEETSIEVRGNRSATATNWSTATAGPTIIQLNAGADHLLFKNINFTNCGNGCFRVAAPVNDITMDTMVATNVRRFIESTISAPAVTCPVSALRVRNVLVEGYSKGGIHIKDGSDNVSFENVVCDSLRQDGDNFAVGFDLGNTTNLVMTDCVGRNSKDVIPNQGPPVSFYNGDGCTGERGGTFTMLRCTMSGNTDAGFDLKGNGTLTECKAFGNRANFKLWGTANLVDCHGYDPIIRFPVPEAAGDEPCQVEIDGASAQVPNVTCTDCTFVDQQFDAEGSVFRVTTGSLVSYLTTVNTSVQKHASTPIVDDTSGTAVVTLDTKAGPVFTVDPVISAISTAGETSTVTPGTVTGGVTDAFQWFRRPTADTLAVHIDDAISAGYTATAEDVGCAISCRQYTVDTDGYMTEATSLESAIIAASSLSLLTPPTISGPPGVNGVLSVVAGTYDGIPPPTLTYAWEVALVETGETGTTHTNVTGDIGSTVTVVETADNGSGSPIVTRSAAVGPIVASLAVAYVAPAAAGNASGSSFANALAWSSINSVIASMAPGGLIYQASHLGNYTGQVTISHGGTAVDPLVYLAPDEDGNQVAFYNSGGTRAPVEIRGVDATLTPTVATFVRSRTSWTKPAQPGEPYGPAALVDPFTTSAGSALVNVFSPAHGLDLNLVGAQQVLFRGQVAVGGITLSSTTYYNLTVVDPNNFRITHTSVASSGVTGGGTVRYETTISVSAWAIGTPSIYLTNGADNLKFSYMNFTRCGNEAAVALASGTNIENIEFDHVNFYNCQRFLRMSTGDANQHGNSITGCYIHDMVGVGYSKQAIGPRSDSSLWVIEDVILDSGRQDRDNFAGGISIEHHCQDVAIRRCIISNSHDTTSSFWNGDCISGERNNSNILVEDCELFQCSDAGMDCKAPNTWVRRVYSYDNKECLKLWGLTGVVVDECVLEDSFKRGGSWTNRLLEINTPEGAGGLNGPDITIKSTTFEYTGTASTALGTNSSLNQIICRQLDNTFTNVSSGTDVVPVNALNLSGLLTDVTAPTITTATTFNAYGGQTLFIPLTSDEGTSFAIVGGADQAQFGVVDTAQLNCTVWQIGLYLRMTGQTYSALDTDRVVTIRAKDAASNSSADHTITVTILAGAAPATFECQWEGANNATTATDIAGGKTITFAGNAKLTTTTPIAGVSSLLLDGTNDRCTLANHADWYFPEQFTLMADVNLVSNAATGTIMRRGTSGSDSAWSLEVVSGGYARFTWWTTSSSSSIIAPTAGLTTGVNHQVLVDRDGTTSGKIRLYVDGVMVASANANSPFKVVTSGVSIGSLSASFSLNGRVDNTKIWKGYAFCGSDSGYTIPVDPLAAWSDRYSLTDGAATAVTDYCIKILLTVANFDFTGAQSDGADIRVYDNTDAVFLPIWIKSYDSVGQTAEIWARVSDIANEHLLLAGNSSAEWVSDGEEVFDWFQPSHLGVNDEVAYPLARTFAVLTPDASNNIYQSDSQGKPARGKAWLEDIGSISTSTNSTPWYASRVPHQHSSFYSAGRWWLFYADYSGGGAGPFTVKFRSSATQAGLAAAGDTSTGKTVGLDAQWTILYDEVTSRVHFAANISAGVSPLEHNGLAWQRGTPEADGSITWDAALQTVIAAGSFVGDFSMAVASDGHVWFGYGNSGGGDAVDGDSVCIRNANTDGTWSTSAGFPVTIIAGDIGDLFCILNPIDAGKMHSLTYCYAVDDAARARIIDTAGTVTSEGDFTTTVVEASGFVSGGAQVGRIDAAALDGVVHAAYTASGGGSVLYRNRAADTTMSTELVPSQGRCETVVASPRVSFVGTTIVVTWSDAAFLSGSAFSYSMWFVTSSDGGATFTRPHCFRGGSKLESRLEHLMPSLADGGTGKLLLTYLTDTYMLTTAFLNIAATFGAELTRSWEIRKAHSSSASANITGRCMVPNAASAVQWDLDFRADSLSTNNDADNNDNFTMFTLRDFSTGVTSGPAVVLYGQGPQLGYINNIGHNKIQAFTLATWYSSGIYLKAGSVYDLYFEDASIATNVAWAAAPADVSQLVTQFSSRHTGVVYMANLRQRPRVATEPSITVAAI